MSSDAKIQINIKSGEGFDATLVNVYAQNPGELASLLDAVTQYAPQIAEARGAVATAHGIAIKSVDVKSDGGPTQDGYPPADVNGNAWQNQGPPPGWVPNQGQQQTQQPQYSQPNNGAPACQHGPMVWREAKPGSGKNWKGWFCPTPQGTPNQCKPNFA